MTVLQIPRVLLSFSGADCKSSLRKFKSAALSCNNQFPSSRLCRTRRAAVPSRAQPHRTVAHCCILQTFYGQFKGIWLPFSGWVRREKETGADKKSTDSEWKRSRQRQIHGKSYREELRGETLPRHVKEIAAILHTALGAASTLSYQNVGGEGVLCIPPSFPAHFNMF